MALLGNLILCSVCLQHLEKWPKIMPICVHAEGQTLAAVLMLAQLCQRPLHVCHVATKAEVRRLLVFTVFMHQFVFVCVLAVAAA